MVPLCGFVLPNTRPEGRSQDTLVAGVFSDHTLCHALPPMPPVLISLHPTDDPDRPPNPAEGKVCDYLMALGEGYVVRWGFDTSDETGAGQGEGDFLVLGPDGNVLHIEVKSGPVTFDRNTSRFATKDGENPLHQRDRVWKLILGRLKQQAGMMGLREPLVVRQLGLPDVTISPGTTVYETMPREALLDVEDLKDLAARWQTIFTRTFEDAEQRRDVFLAVFGAGLKPGVTEILLDYTDRMIERQTAASYPLLDALRENRQFLFQGGPGTGKTWLALELAKRWAAGERRVLFLTYNLKLAEFLRAAAAKLALPALHVFSYEGLAGWMHEQAGEPMASPDHGDREACARFFNIELPQQLLTLADSLDSSLLFDALIVDEAQDHDSVFDPGVAADPDLAGWWEIYKRLLREQGNAQVAVFCDVNQRHFARPRGLFDPGHLTRIFPHLVKVRLRKTLRYTRKLRDFFLASGLPEAAELLANTTDEGLPEGLPPRVEAVASAKEEKSAVGRIVSDWCKIGPCRPEDVLILYPTTAARPKWLENEKVNGVSLARRGVPGVAHLSVHKAKGLEAKGVILVGFPPATQLKGPTAPPGAGATWMMGVTRARDLLAVVERKDLNPADLHTS